MVEYSTCDRVVLVLMQRRGRFPGWPAAEQPVEDPCPGPGRSVKELPHLLQCLALGLLADEGGGETQQGGQQEDQGYSATANTT